LPQERTEMKPPTSAEKSEATADKFAGKRSVQAMKKDYEKVRKEFIEKSTQRIQSLLRSMKEESNMTEEKKQEIYRTIDIIRQEMSNYTAETKSGKKSASKEPVIAEPPKKEKAFSPTMKQVKKKYELMLEDIVPECQNYPSLIQKLKVQLHSLYIT